MPLRIGISLGDLTGIGPEVTLKALAGELQADEGRYVLIGDIAHAQELNQRLGLKLPLQVLAPSESPGTSATTWPVDGLKNQAGRVFIWNPQATPLPPGLAPGAPEAARAAVAALDAMTKAISSPRRLIRKPLCAPANHSSDKPRCSPKSRAPSAPR